MKTFTLILSLAIVAISSAFLKQAQPHQAPAAEIEPKGFLSVKVEFDEGLDNPHVQADDAITAARKCGFCMGKFYLGGDFFTNL